MLMVIAIVSIQLSRAMPDGQIAYLAGRDLDDRTLCLLDTASGESSSIGNGRRDGPPRWAPDAAWIAYTTQGEDGLEVRIVRPDGSESRTVSSAHDWNEHPRWSSDGRFLAYSGGNGLQRRVMVYDFETGQEAEYGAGRSPLLRPVWLPRNDLLLLLTSEDSAWAARVVPDEGDLVTTPALLAIGIIGLPGSFTTDMLVVTPHGAAELPPSVLPSVEPHEEWSAEPAPDGKALAFESNDGGDREVYVLTRRGAANVSNHHAADWNPEWTSDGRWLAFESFRSGMQGIYRISRDSVRVIPVAVDDHADCWGATWSPDGKWLAYVSNRNGRPAIYATEIASGDTHALTDVPGEALAPSWAPREVK